MPIGWTGGPASSLATCGSATSTGRPRIQPNDAVAATTRPPDWVYSTKVDPIAPVAAWASSMVSCSPDGPVSPELRTSTRSVRPSRSATGSSGSQASAAMLRVCPGTARESRPWQAELVEAAAHEPGAVGDDALHAQLDHQVEVCRLVDRPHVHVVPAVVQPASDLRMGAQQPDPRPADARPERQPAPAQARGQQLEQHDRRQPGRQPADPADRERGERHDGGPHLVAGL